MHGLEAPPAAFDLGLDGRHAAALSGGHAGVLHGSRSYLLQDDDGQITEAFSPTTLCLLTREAGTHEWAPRIADGCSFDAHLEDARNLLRFGMAARNDVLAVEVERRRADQ